MKTGCLAPALLPDLEHLAVVMLTSRTFYLTDEPFSRKASAHRAKIRTANGVQWLHVPVRTEDRRKPYSEVRTDPDTADWVNSWTKALDSSYGNSVYYDFYRDELLDDFRRAAEYSLLDDVLTYLNKRLFTYLELNELFSEKTSRTTSTEFTNYISQNPESTVIIESRGRYYRKPGRIPAASIQEFSGSLPKYRQQFPGFEPGCSILDLLFHYGPQYFEITDGVEL